MLSVFCSDHEGNTGFIKLQTASLELVACSGKRPFILGKANRPYHCHGRILETARAPKILPYRTGSTRIDALRSRQSQPSSGIDVQNRLEENVGRTKCDFPGACAIGNVSCE